MNQFERKLLSGDVVAHPTAGLRGNAKKWSGTYWAAWQKAIKNLEKSGYTVMCCTGPMGGTTTKNTYFKAVKREVIERG